MTYLETVNHLNFREASKLVWNARIHLEEIMSKEEAYGWIKAWASGAGDGDGGDDDE